jgi:putative transposase
MIEALFLLVSLIRSSLKNQTELALENLALRQQLAILNRNRPQPRLRKRDRLFWACLFAVWQQWRGSLIVVKPETVVLWHRKGFALYWMHLSKRNGAGRPGTGKDIRDLIHKMANANPTWRSPRLHGELSKLRIKISERTVARLMAYRLFKRVFCLLCLHPIVQPLIKSDM